SDGLRCNPGSEEFDALWRDLEDYFAQRPKEREAPTIMYVIKPKDEKSLEGWKDEVLKLYEENTEYWREGETHDEHLTSSIWKSFEGTWKEAKALELTSSDYDGSSWKVENGTHRKMYIPYVRTFLDLFEDMEWREDEDGRKSQPYLQLFVLKSHLIDIINKFHSNHVEAARLLISLTKSSKLIVQTIVEQLLSTHRPLKDVYYCILTMELCKLLPDFPQMLAISIDYLFDKLEDMDTECVSRFIVWFSHHLSNFDFKWPWNSWDYMVQPNIDEDAIQTQFVRRVLDRCIRLSYYDRVKKSLPENFHPLLPPPPNPIFKFDSDESVGHAEYKELVEKIRNKEGWDDISDYTKGEDFQKIEPEGGLEVLCHAILKVGSKSYAHLMGVMDRCVPILQGKIQGYAQQIVLLDAIHDVWMNSPIQMNIIIDKLMVQDIVQPLSIANYVFAKTEWFDQPFLWDVLSLGINKSINKIHSIKSSCQDRESNRNWEGEETLERAERDQKEMFIIIFHRFNIIISNYVNQLASGEVPEVQSNVRIKSTLGHFIEIARRYYDQFHGFLSTLHTFLLSEHADQRIRTVFIQLQQI
ncbi:nuclear cap binding protein subunit 1, 80kDa-like, partial [Planoprotostelium fungivorum]